jgi:hypothetical protein
MNAFLPSPLVVFTVISATAQDQPEPAAQYQELLKAYSTAAGSFRAATTDVERKQAVERTAEFPQKFIELADKHRTDPVALLALRQAVQAVNSLDSLTQQAWEMNREAFPDGCSSDSTNRIVELLLRDHLKSDQLAPICDRMRYCVRKEFEKFLSAALESNPHRSIQGLACLVLAQVLRNQLYIVDRVSVRPEWIARYDTILGKEYFQTIRGPGRAALQERIESLYERATQFDDVPNFSNSETVADKARTELFDLRHLSIGKLAPEIEGQDQDGQRFKLSDYRGKVVLLYFWSEY